MVTPAELTTRLRKEADLTQAELAERAGCTRSTIARIEAGRMDPTVTMLARIASAAGRTLAISAPRRSDPSTLRSVASASTDLDNADWTVLRGLIDRIELHDERAAEAIADPPARTGDLALDNLIAAIAEKIADDRHLHRPAWTRAVPPLPEAWEPAGTPRMRAHEAATAPRQFVARNLLLGALNLWRNT